MNAAAPTPAPPFWALDAAAVLAAQGSGPDGLDPDEAARRLGERRRPRRRGRGALAILAGQFLQPMIVLLLVAAGISIPLGETRDALVILAIVALSGGLGFAQEYRAENAVRRLLSLVKIQAGARRGGQAVEVALDEIVPGDVVVLAAGATVPGDARLLTVNGLQVDESALTGESFPASKRADAVSADAPVGKRSSVVFLGTHVVSGRAEAVVVAVGSATELGKVAGRLERTRPPTTFDLALRHFGTLVLRVSLLLVLAIFAVNVFLDRPVVDAFLFSVALAVGLVPELLPVIVTVNLASGARRLAQSGVIVKRLAGIEDLGAVDVLCSDKTGTLTEGRIRLHAALDVDGAPSAQVLELAWLNATFESGYESPIDAALRDARPAGSDEGWRGTGEVPYDFVRRRLSVRLARGDECMLVTKGQLAQLLDTCESAQRPDGSRVPIDEIRAAIEAQHATLAEQGLRVLGVATKSVSPRDVLGPELECDLIFQGVLAFTDPPKSDVGRVLDQLAHLGIAMKIVTGDDHRVARHVWTTLVQREPRLLRGQEIHALTAEALERRCLESDVFAEVDPGEKEQIISALRRAGRVVAYLGDGINDAPALHASDVGITVESAADVAREAADVVLRRRDLEVIVAGVREGRRTMANTLTYVYYTTSANFGNMVSMAVASLFLPFLPLLPKQILLNNFLSDIPAMSIAGDRLDADRASRPGRFRTREIRDFMIVFGLISSVFDLASFYVIVKLVAGAPVAFRSGWFFESLATELLVLFVMRTRGRVWRSRPGNAMMIATGGVLAVAIALVTTGLGRTFDLAPLPAEVLTAIAAITLAYVATTELVKQWFFARAARIV